MYSQIFRTLIEYTNLFILIAIQIFLNAKKFSYHPQIQNNKGSEFRISETVYQIFYG